MTTEQLPIVGSVAACENGCACDADAAPATAPGLRRLAWRLTVVTIVWNTAEALVAIVGAVLAGSIALMGFGLDSVVEVASAVIISWRLTRHHADEAAERRAVRLIAVSFFGIAAYIMIDGVLSLVGVQGEPKHTPVGIGLTALSLVVMPSLAWGKRRAAARMGSVALKADAAETQLCTYLSAVVFLGLAANTLAGWWWMDPIAGFIVAALAVKEGREAWVSGDLCACG